MIRCLEICWLICCLIVASLRKHSLLEFRHSLANWIKKKCMKQTFFFSCLFFFFLRTEMVEIQLDTYTADTISAHRKIRQDLIYLISPVSQRRMQPVSHVCFLESSVLVIPSANLTLFLLLHLCCREKLECELKAFTTEKQAVELKLSSFEILGKEFEALADEYCRLRQEIEMKNWALKELTQYKEK